MRSMTGYSKISYNDENFKIEMEIKSVNNKNLNLKIKLPNTLSELEVMIRNRIGDAITRGSIDLRIEFEDKRESENSFEYDKSLCKAYLKILTNMEEELGEKFSNKIEYLTRNLNVIKKRELNSSDYNLLIEEQLKRLLGNFIEFKVQEGNRLKVYFEERIEVIQNNLKNIKFYKENVVKDYKEKLIKRLELIRENIKFNEEDILKEILLFTDKCDISEEISRLDSHLIQLREELKKDDNSIGKKIDFILQEMFREFNTTGVKSSSYEISKLVVECKNEIEKIREQAMNIE